MDATDWSATQPGSNDNPTAVEGPTQSRKPQSEYANPIPPMEDIVTPPLGEKTMNFWIEHALNSQEMLKILKEQKFTRAAKNGPAVKTSTANKQIETSTAKTPAKNVKPKSARVSGPANVKQKTPKIIQTTMPLKAEELDDVMSLEDIKEKLNKITSRPKSGGMRVARKVQKNTFQPAVAEEAGNQKIEDEMIEEAHTFEEKSMESDPSAPLAAIEILHTPEIAETQIAEEHNVEDESVELEHSAPLDQMVQSSEIVETQMDEGHKFEDAMGPELSAPTAEMQTLINPEIAEKKVEEGNDFEEETVEPEIRDPSAELEILPTTEVAETQINEKPTSLINPEAEMKKAEVPQEDILNVEGCSKIADQSEDILDENMSIAENNEKIKSLSPTNKENIFPQFDAPKKLTINIKEKSRIIEKPFPTVCEEDLPDSVNYLSRSDYHVYYTEHCYGDINKVQTRTNNSVSQNVQSIMDRVYPDVDNFGRSINYTVKPSNQLRPTISTNPPSTTGLKKISFVSMKRPPLKMISSKAAPIAMNTKPTAAQSSIPTVSKTGPPAKSAMPRLIRVAQRSNRNAPAPRVVKAPTPPNIEKVPNPVDKTSDANTTSKIFEKHSSPTNVNSFTKMRDAHRRSDIILKPGEYINIAEVNKLDLDTISDVAQENNVGIGPITIASHMPANEALPDSKPMEEITEKLNDNLSVQIPDVEVDAENMMSNTDKPATPSTDRAIQDRMPMENITEEFNDVTVGPIPRRKRAVRKVQKRSVKLEAIVEEILSTTLNAEEPANPHTDKSIPDSMPMENSTDIFEDNTVEPIPRRRRAVRKIQKTSIELPAVEGDDVRTTISDDTPATPSTVQGLSETPPKENITEEQNEVTKEPNPPRKCAVRKRKAATASEVEEFPESEQQENIAEEHIEVTKESNPPRKRAVRKRKVTTISTVQQLPDITSNKEKLSEITEQESSSKKVENQLNKKDAPLVLMGFIGSNTAVAEDELNPFNDAAQANIGRGGLKRLMMSNLDCDERGYSGHSNAEKKMTTKDFFEEIKKRRLSYEEDDTAEGAKHGKNTKSNKPQAKVPSKRRKAKPIPFSSLDYFRECPWDQYEDGEMDIWISRRHIWYLGYKKSEHKHYGYYDPLPPHIHGKTVQWVWNDRIVTFFGKGAK